MAIQLAIGAPISMLDDLCVEGEIELCFAHLFEPGSSEYQEYYFAAKRSGRFVILDNGIMERGVAMGTGELISLSARLAPDLVTPPEILHDSRATLELTREFTVAFRRTRLYPTTGILAAAHGSTYADWCQSFEELAQIREVTRIGIPYDIDFELPHAKTSTGPRLRRLVARRAALCQWIAEHHPATAIHLFGLAHPSELSTAVQHPFIKSVDTSLPVMAALAGIRYEQSSFGPFHKEPLQIAATRTQERVDLAKHNILTLKHWLSTE